MGLLIHASHACAGASLSGERGAGGLLLDKVQCVPFPLDPALPFPQYTSSLPSSAPFPPTPPLPSPPLCSLLCTLLLRTYGSFATVGTNGTNVLADGPNKDWANNWVCTRRSNWHFWSSNVLLYGVFTIATRFGVKAGSILIGLLLQHNWFHFLFFSDQLSSIIWGSECAKIDLLGNQHCQTWSCPL